MVSYPVLPCVGEPAASAPQEDRVIDMSEHTDTKFLIILTRFHYGGLG